MTDGTQTTLVRRATPMAAPGWRSDLRLILPPLLALFGAMLNFGAAAPARALAWAAIGAAVSAWLCAYAALTGRLYRLPTLQLAALIAFVALLVWFGLTLTPLAGFPVPQAWAIVGPPGALTLDRAATLVEILKLAGLGAVFVSGWVVAQDEVRSERALTTLLTLGGAYAVWSIAAFVADPAAVFGVPKTFHTDRLTGSFLSANTAGSLFGVFALAAWITALRSLRAYFQGGAADAGGRRKLFAAAAFRVALTLLFWAALLFTVSRAAMVSTVACLALFTGVEIIDALNRQKAGLGKIIGYTAPAILLIIVVFAATIGHRFVGELSSLGQDRGSREYIFSLYGRLAADAPLAGYGLGTFQALNDTLITHGNFGVLWNLGAAHNIYIQWLLEAGLIGSLGMVLVLGLVLVDIARRRVSARSGRTRANIALAATALLLIHNSVDYSIQVPAVAALWAFLLGLGAAPATAERSSGRRRRSVRGQRGAQQDQLDGELAGGIADPSRH